jgi:glycosyltransferase involved in cell wall biosynthesis
VSQPRHVLFVLEFFPPHVGGVETLFAGLTQRLAARGHRVTVLTSRLPDTPRREVVHGVSIFRVSVPPIARRYFFTLAAIVGAIRLAGHADIIHTTTYNAALPAWVAGRVRRRPVVITVHEVWDRIWNELPNIHPIIGWGFRLFEAGVLRLPFDAYHCVSEHTRRRLVELAGADPERAHTVHNAVDVEFWTAPRARVPLTVRLGLPHETFVYLTFGRPGVAKGLEYLIDAAVQVRQAMPRSHLVMLLSRSPMSQYSRLVARIERHGLGDHVTVLPPAAHAELPAYVDGADCVVVPSLTEGFGFSAIEAALRERPVVATSGHALEEVLAGALLVPPGDAAALAEAIVRVGTADPPPVPHATTSLDAEKQIAAIIDLYDRVI